MSIDDIDFDDHMVRSLVEKNHVPEERWLDVVAGMDANRELLISGRDPGKPHIRCTCCLQKWPCEIRQALRTWHSRQAEDYVLAKGEKLVNHWLGGKAK